MHQKRYDGCCKTHHMIIPKATWTSSILNNKSTCLRSFNNASLMKEEVSKKDPIGILKNLKSSKGVLNKVGRVKSLGKLDGDKTTHICEVELKGQSHN